MDVEILRLASDGQEGIGLELKKKITHWCY